MLKKQGDTFYVQARSPINIALVKYWGKVDKSLIIPANSSLSITVDKKDLCSSTKVSLIPKERQLEQIVIVLNGEKAETISQRI